MKHLFTKIEKHSALIVIIGAALLLQLVSAMQFDYMREMMELELERDAMTDLNLSAVRIQEKLRHADAAADAMIWNIEQHLSDPEYMELVVTNLVQDVGDNIIGSAIAFRPNYFPSEGYYFECYARQWDDSISLRNIGSEVHDYTKMEFYKAAMNGDTTVWSAPYLDNEGAQAVVTTYALPILDEDRNPVGVLAVDMDTRWIGDVVNLHHSYPTSFSLVVEGDLENGEGQLVAAPNDSVASPALVEKIVAMMNDSTVEREMKRHGRVTCFPFFDDERGEEGHVYYIHKRHAPHWHMVVVCYDDEVFGALDSMRMRIMLIALAGLVILGFMTRLFILNHRRLQATRFEQERMSSELRIAENIQRQMLPREIDCQECSVHSLLLPAREVGGDLYDFFVRDEKLFFCIGDVSGKGVPAAMLMAVIHSLFRSASAHESNPDRIVQSVNEASCQGNDSNMFVTLFVGVLDLPTGRLRFSNAGHDFPIVILPTAKSSGNVADAMEMLDRTPNLPVGAFDDIKYACYEYMLTPGSTLFLFTDGLTEARKNDGELFGLDRVKNVVVRSLGRDTESLLTAQLESVKEFVDGAVQSDDLTMLAIHYTPSANDYLLHETLTLKNDLREVTKLGAFLKDVLGRIELDKSTISGVRLAVEEGVVNVMNYAYPIGTEGTVTVEARADDKRLKIIISDSGAAFDPTEAIPSDMAVPVEERQIGGNGIRLMRKVMDSMNYERIDGKNILTLRKNFSKGE